LPPKMRLACENGAVCTNPGCNNILNPPTAEGLVRSWAACSCCVYYRNWDCRAGWCDECPFPQRLPLGTVPRN
jgi:hypothetical protein